MTMVWMRLECLDGIEFDEIEEEEKDLDGRRDR